MWVCSHGTGSTKTYSKLTRLQQELIQILARNEGRDQVAPVGLHLVATGSDDSVQVVSLCERQRDETTATCAVNSNVQRSLRRHRAGSG